MGGRAGDAVHSQRGALKTPGLNWDANLSFLGLTRTWKEKKKKNSPGKCQVAERLSL